MESGRLSEINPHEYFLYTTKLIHDNPEIDPAELTPYAVRDKVPRIQVNF